MSKVISIAGEKGGCSKTTTTISLGAGLLQQGKKVLLVDNDPIANMTMALGIEPDQLNKTLSDLMSSKMNDENYIFDKTEYIIEKEGLHILPSDIRLSGIENSLVNILSREFVLRSILDEIKSEYDLILIDNPPSLGMLVINALAASDSVIVPAQAQYLSLRGLELLLNTIAKVKKQINRSLEIEGILITMYNQRTNLSKEVKRTIEDSYGHNIRIFTDIVNYSIKAAETSAIGESIFTHDPEGPIAKSYMGVVKELISHEK